MVKKTKTITRRKFTGNIWIMAVLVLITVWSVIGLLIPLAYYLIASENITEEIKE